MFGFSIKSGKKGDRFLTWPRAHTPKGLRFVEVDAIGQRHTNP
eukprot:COSAG06_NODE_16332_length_1006_cov_845.047409_2_plen_42_part_01